MERAKYHYSDLLDFDEELYTNLAHDKDVEILMITAGIGRIADFQFHHIAEIEKMLTIDTVSTLKIFRVFYERILTEENFYAGVMGSISGWLSSPSASVYAAAKAAVVRFVESVNIELEAYGSTNRILDVSPASFKGSRFYGGKNDLTETAVLADDIVKHLFARDVRFIPNYEETFKGFLKGIIMIHTNMVYIVINTKKNPGDWIIRKELKLAIFLEHLTCFMWDTSTCSKEQNSNVTI